MENSPPRQAEQERWRARLAEAEKRYHEAMRAFQELMPAEPCAPETVPGAREALERTVAARAEYLRVLRIFTDLVLRGKSPRPGE